MARGRPAVVGGEAVNWTEDMGLQELGGGRYRAHVGDHWSSLQGVHGGLVAALVVTAAGAVQRVEGVDPATALRAATFGYVSGNAPGDLQIDVELVRRGRAMVTTHARVTQAGKTTTVARLHHSTSRDGPTFSDAPPMTTRPADAVPLSVGGRAAHLDNVVTFLHPGTTPFAGAPRAEWVAWCRPRHGGALDEAWLAMFGDYFPPAVFTRAVAPNRAVTIEYAIQVHSGARSWHLGEDGHLAARMHAFHSAEGFAVEDGWIHLPDGALLATVRQTRLAG